MRAEPSVSAGTTHVLLPALIVVAAVQVFFGVMTASGLVHLSRSGLSVAVFTQLLAAVGTVASLWRVWLAARYRPVADVGDARLPSVTVIVPAYNEGRQVLLTLRSLSASRYPRERLELIAVDDGSGDDTWQWIRKGAEELGDLVTPVRMVKNGGKKHALAEGIRRAKGEVIVTVDSDSEVLPDTLRNLVAPFVVEDNCGAVAGSVRVLNREGGAIPKMLDATFTAAFDFMRAGESVAGGVLCAPGALTAFRTAYVREVLQEWLDQTFFGLPATIGEDRALTNLVLRTGQTVRYQSTAHVLTQVPENWRVLTRMLIRWGRSDVRESLVMAKFIFRDRRRQLQLVYLWSVIQMMVAAILFVPSIVGMVLMPQVLPMVLASTVLAAIPAVAIVWALRGRAVALWAMPWALYGLVALSWITPWSFVSMHRGGWLTRTLPSKAGREWWLRLAGAFRLF
jgi:hyaluronan synthase